MTTATLRRACTNVERDQLHFSKIMRVSSYTCDTLPGLGTVSVNAEATHFSIIKTCNCSLVAASVSNVQYSRDCSQSHDRNFKKCYDPVARLVSLRQLRWIVISASEQLCVNTPCNAERTLARHVGWFFVRTAVVGTILDVEYKNVRYQIQGCVLHGCITKGMT